MPTRCAQRRQTVPPVLDCATHICGTRTLSAERAACRVAAGGAETCDGHVKRSEPLRDPAGGWQ